MNRYAVITIDTESDHTMTWHKTMPLRFDSVLTGIPYRLQPLFNKYKAVPTYLLAIEVIESAECVKCLKGLEGKYGLGTHLHPEYLEPYKKYMDYGGTLSRDFACVLDPETEFLKIKTLTEKFAERFGYSPASFRAGRFGAGGNTIRSLERLGYKVDTSVTPYAFWKGGRKNLDFTDSPDSPYFPSSDDINKKGNSRILEVPVTIKPRRYMPRGLSVFIERNFWLKNIPLVSRFVYKYLCPIWLEPAFSDEEEMKQLVDMVIETSGNVSAVVNIMFHSMEVTTGASPISATEKKVKLFMDRLDRLLSYLSDQRFEFLSLSELYARF